jgi:hypothetical protein
VALQNYTTDQLEDMAFVVCNPEGVVNSDSDPSSGYGGYLCWLLSPSDHKLTGFSCSTSSVYEWIEAVSKLRTARENGTADQVASILLSYPTHVLHCGNAFNYLYSFCSC